MGKLFSQGDLFQDLLALKRTWETKEGNNLCVHEGDSPDLNHKISILKLGLQVQTQIHHFQNLDGFIYSPVEILISNILHQPVLHVYAWVIN